MSTPPTSSLRAFLWYFIKEQRVKFTLILLATLTWSLDQTIWPYITKLFVDGLISYSGDEVGIYYYLRYPIIWGLGMWIFFEIMMRLAGFASAKLIPSFEADIRLKMFEYVQGHSYQYFSDHLAGSVANKINDMARGATEFLGILLWSIIPVISGFFIALFLLAQVSLLFSLFLSIWFIGHMLISIYWARRSEKASIIHSESRSQLTGRIVDSLTNIINTKLFATSRYERLHLSQFQEDERRKYTNQCREVEKMRLYSGIFCILLLCIGYNWLMIWFFQKGFINVGDAVMILFLGTNVVGMSWFAGSQLPLLVKTWGLCKQALTVMQEAHDLVDQEGAKELYVPKGEVIYDRVRFAHNGSSPIFDNKTVKISSGKKVGLVGVSGSGKSTFVNLILRHFDVDGGRILIDGMDIRGVSQDSLHRNVAMIPQDVTMFHRSLMENIRYGRVGATDDEVVEAAKKAHAHEFIQGLEKGYDTLVGERGIKLSGGQRQRVAIARAVLKDAPILILDEATSALDSAVERKIQEALELVMRNRTTLVIAHRLSTLVSMDRILVLDKGRIVEEGSHSELLKLGGHYAMLWKMQAGGFISDSPSET